MTIAFSVDGIPVPKGSARSYVSKRGKLSTVQDNKDRLIPWEAAVGWRARAAGLRPTDAPCIVSAVFRMPRPKSHYGARGLRPSAPRHHAIRPDTDKLIRAILDALTGIAWMDDSQVVDLHPVKRYVEDGEVAGVDVVVTRLEEGGAF